MGFGKKGQIWVETVIYTLIGLGIIGLVLTISTPKIERMKTEAIIKQSEEALSNIDAKISDVMVAQGNKRVVDLSVGKGNLNIDTDNDRIFWVIESPYQYSQEGVVIPKGPVNLITENKQGWQVTIMKDYDLDIQFGEKTSGVYPISASSTNYRMVIENSGTNDDGQIVVKITA